jgi:hypothetical protein
MATIRNAAVYFGGKKVAEIETADYDIDSGDEPQHGTDGLLGYSNGQVTTKITCNVIVPVSGLTVTIEDALVNKRPVLIGWLGGGKMHQIKDMRVMRASYKSDSKAGSLKGTFEFNGGAPNITG